MEIIKKLLTKNKIYYKIIKKNKGGRKMKSFIRYILILIIGIILGYFITIYNIEITVTEKTETGELLQVKAFYNDFNYYVEF